METTTRLPSHDMVAFLAGMRLDALPGPVVRAARLRLLDSLACGLYGADTPWSRIAAEVVFEEGSRGRASVLGQARTAAPARAALVNGTATHGYELDDLVAGGVHPGAVVVPAVLAIAEEFGLSGERVLLGIVAGYEAGARVGLGIGPVSWAVHKTGIGGAAAAAAGCATALGLSEEETLRALGVAASFASGIKSFVQGGGGMIKRMHAGRAAESGVLAALLARRGFTAALGGLDGKFGLLEAFGVERPDPSRLNAGLGAEFFITGAQTKTFPFCYGLHTLAQAVLALREGHAITPEDVAEIRIGTNLRAVTVHGETAPADTMSAQYSMPFVAGVSLAGDPRDPRAFAGEALADAAVLGLARRVRLYNAPEMDEVAKASRYPRHGAMVEIVLRDGARLSRTELDAKGTPRNPCSEADVLGKFRTLAGLALPAETVEALAGLVERIEGEPDMERLSGLLRVAA